MFPSHVARATDVKKQLEEGGIVFTEGTSVGFDDESSLIVVTHRYSVQPQVRQILKAKGLLGGQVEQVTIEARFLKMSRTLAEELFDDEGGLSKSCFLNEKILKRIMDLGRKGKIVELARPKLTTVSGNTAQVKAVREHRYPTDVVSFVPGQRSTNTTTGSVSVTPATPSAPGSFETREIGYLLNVTPVISPDGSVIGLTLVPEISSVAPKPRQYSLTTPSGKVTIEQPEFSSYQTTTTVQMKSGQTMLLAVMDPVPDDGKLTQPDVVLLLLSASIIRE
jgi:hypothetical protein